MAPSKIRAIRAIRGPTAFGSGVWQFRRMTFTERTTDDTDATDKEGMPWLHQKSVLSVVHRLSAPAFGNFKER